MGHCDSGCRIQTNRRSKVKGTWIRTDKENGDQSPVAEVALRERLAGVYIDVDEALTAGKCGLSVETPFARYHFLPMEEG